LVYGLDVHRWFGGVNDVRRIAAVVMDVYPVKAYVSTPSTDDG